MCNHVGHDENVGNLGLSEDDIAEVERFRQRPGKEGHMRPVGHSAFARSYAGEIDVLDSLEPERFW